MIKMILPMLQLNPEMLQQIMSLPVVQNVLRDPETRLTISRAIHSNRQMIHSIPQLRQLMEECPEIVFLLEDPEKLKQKLANPSEMQELMRNAVIKYYFNTAMRRLDAVP